MSNWLVSAWLFFKLAVRFVWTTIGPATIAMTVAFVGAVIAAFLPAPQLAAALPLSACVAWLVTAKMWARLRYREPGVALRAFVPYSQGWNFLLGVAFGVAALRVLTPVVSPFATDAWDSVRASFPSLSGIPFSMILLTVTTAASAAVLVACVVVGVRAARLAAKESEATLVEHEVFLENLANVLDVNVSVLLEAVENNELTYKEEGVGSVRVRVPNGLRKKLRDEEWLNAQLVEFMPEFEVEAGGASTVLGTLTLTPLSDRTDLKRLNIEQSQGLTDKRFEVADSDTRRGRADLSFSLED